MFVNSSRVESPSLPTFAVCATTRSGRSLARSRSQVPGSSQWQPATAACPLLRASRLGVWRWKEHFSVTNDLALRPVPPRVLFPCSVFKIDLVLDMAAPPCVSHALFRPRETLPDPSGSRKPFLPGLRCPTHVDKSLPFTDPEAHAHTIFSSIPPTRWVRALLGCTTADIGRTTCRSRLTT